MNSYGQSAVNAALRARGGDPVAAWEVAVAQAFPKSKSMRCKGCPRGAFLGLCQAGLVGGVRKGDYTRSILNRQYAVEAVRILRNKTELAGDPIALWRHVLGGVKKKPNSQMEVVVALWNAGLIEESRK